MAKSRSTSAVGNFNFSVKIYSIGSESPVLTLPADSIKGIGDARTTVMRHRVNPQGWAVTTPYSGISTPEPVTIEGSYLFDAADIISLQEWHQQAQGKVHVAGTEAIAGYYREIVVMPTSEDSSGVIVGSSIKLLNCMPVRVSIADFDLNAPAISNWSIEIEFEDMIVNAT